MLVFLENKAYKHKKTGVVREVAYTYNDPKNSKMCVVFKGGEGNYAVDICNEYEYSTIEELKKYSNERKQELEKLNNDRTIEINKSGIKVLGNNKKIVFTIS